MDLDLQVSRAVMAVRLMERVLHEPTGWTIEYGGREFPAVVHRGDDGVSVVTKVAGPFLSLSGRLALRHRGEELGVREIEGVVAAPGKVLTLRWIFQLEVVPV